MLSFNYATCFIIGAGGTCTQGINAFAQLLKFHENGTNNFIIFDGDNYEDSNLSRQVFPVDAIGENKAVVTAERLRQNLPGISVDGVPKYVDAKLLRAYFENHGVKDTEGKIFNLVILTIDNDSSRKIIIRELDKLAADGYNIACVLPGNGYHTANILWYLNVNGNVFPVHPLDVASNWDNPQDHPVYSCQYESVSSPQLINANFASAMLTLSVLRALLDGRDLPTVINYNDNTHVMNVEN